MTTTATKLKKLTFAGETWRNVLVSRGAYPGGELALTLDAGGEPLTVASVNLAPAYGLVPAEGCIFVKDYGENAGLLAALAEAGVLRPTGRTVSFGPWGTTASEAEVLI